MCVTDWWWVGYFCQRLTDGGLVTFVSGLLMGDWLLLSAITALCVLLIVGGLVTFVSGLLIVGGFVTFVSSHCAVCVTDGGVLGGLVT